MAPQKPLPIIKDQDRGDENWFRGHQCMKPGMNNVKEAQLEEDSIPVFVGMDTKKNSSENRNVQNGKHLISNIVVQEI